MPQDIDPTIAPGAWRAALVKALSEPLHDGSRRTRLEALAESFVDQAFEKKDLALFKEIAAVVDGKGRKDDQTDDNATSIAVMDMIATAVNRAAHAFGLRPVIDVVPRDIKQKTQPLPAGRLLTVVKTD